MRPLFYINVNTGNTLTIIITLHSDTRQVTTWLSTSINNVTIRPIMWFSAYKPGHINKFQLDKNLSSFANEIPPVQHEYKRSIFHYLQNKTGFLKGITQM